MSMCYSMKQASDASIDAMLANPRLFAAFMHGEDLEVPKPQTGGFPRLFNAEEESGPEAAPVDELDLDDSGETADLDKAWQALHYLLCGKEWQAELPEGFLLSYQEILPETDSGYGEAQALRPNHLKQIDQFLETVTADMLSERFDGPKMQEMGIYAINGDDPEEIDYLVESFEILKPFIARTAAADLGLVMALA